MDLLQKNASIGISTGLVKGVCAVLNSVILMGRLTRDPELRQTQTGLSVCSFSIAVDRNYAKDRERQTDFIDIVAWRQTAEFVFKYFTKGKQIIIEGAIQTRSYEDKNGGKRTAVEVLAERVQFGESSSKNAAPSSPPAPSPQPAQEAVHADFAQMDGDSDDLPF